MFSYISKTKIRCADHSGSWKSVAQAILNATRSVAQHAFHVVLPLILGGFTSDLGSFYLWFGFPFRETFLEFEYISATLAVDGFWVVLALGLACLWAGSMVGRLGLRPPALEIHIAIYTLGHFRKSKGPGQEPYRNSWICIRFAWEQPFVHQLPIIIPNIWNWASFEKEGAQAQSHADILGFRFGRIGSSILTTSSQNRYRSLGIETIWEK